MRTKSKVIVNQPAKNEIASQKSLEEVFPISISSFVWRYFLIIALMVMLAWGITGCAPEEVVPPEEAVVEMTAGEGYFEPDVIMVDQGQDVTVVIENVTEEDHTFTIDELGIDVSLVPGAQGEVTFTAAEEGSFEFYCDEPGHRDAGMYGYLEVREEPYFPEDNDEPYGDDDNDNNGVY